MLSGKCWTLFSPEQEFQLSSAHPAQTIRKPFAQCLEELQPESPTYLQDFI